MRFFSFLIAAIGAVVAAPLHAEESDAAQTACSGQVWWADSEATFSDFDFWIGKWQVFDRESGLMVGVDQVRRELAGCIVVQHWTHMNDLYTPPGSPRRMEGYSHTSLGADGMWHQTWIDNGGSRLPLTGKLDEKGVMTMQTPWIEFTTRDGKEVSTMHRWHWAPQDDGTIHNTGYTRRGKDGDWVKYFDIVYRRNLPGGPTAYYRTEDPS